MKKGLRDISSLGAFFITSFLFILLGAILMALFDKTVIHLKINAVHNSFLDIFYTYWTYLGDGIVLPLLVLLFGILTFRKYRFTPLILGFSSLVLAGVFSQLLKRLVFNDALRPLEYIGKSKLYLVPGIEVHSSNSFPSGHTTAAFAFFGIIAFIYFAKNKTMQVVLALIAVLVGYSRMYLSQHFLEDVIAGACIGIFCFTLVALGSSILKPDQQDRSL